MQVKRKLHGSQAEVMEFYCALLGITSLSLCAFIGLSALSGEYGEGFYKLAIKIVSNPFSWNFQFYSLSLSRHHAHTL